jgi:DHA1 family bicyclomycin/chloramphenicol resistance-like MFS transporter
MQSSQPEQRANALLIILILGTLSTISPLSIDMYLPGFADMARSLHTTAAKISLSVSSYFIGLACGQLIYGPLLDRYGRKPPLYAGLGLYIVASIGCAFAPDANHLIALRLLEALGGCVAQVAAVAMVRDFFRVEDSAKILSLLMLILGVSPLFAPTLGSLITTSIGWPWVFALLAAIAAVVVAVIWARLPEGHIPDKSISLRPVPILKNFLVILEEAHFSVAAFAGAFSFAGLFVYVAGSPMIFLDMYHVGPRLYGLIFAVLAAGFIGGSQVNVWLSKRHENRKVLTVAVICQNIVGLVLITGILAGWYGLGATFILLLLYLPCSGIAYPNAAAIALAPFSKNAGSASALLGFIQMGVGAAASSGVGMLNAKSAVPVFAVMTLSPLVGLCILAVGHKRLVSPNPQNM